MVSFCGSRRMRKNGKRMERMRKVSDPFLQNNAGVLDQDSGVAFARADLMASRSSMEVYLLSSS